LQKAHYDDNLSPQSYGVTTSIAETENANFDAESLHLVQDRLRRPTQHFNLEVFGFAKYYYVQSVSSQLAFQKLLALWHKRVIFAVMQYGWGKDPVPLQSNARLRLRCRIITANSVVADKLVAVEQRTCTVVVELVLIAADTAVVEVPSARQSLGATPSGATPFGATPSGTVVVVAGCDAHTAVGTVVEESLTLGVALGLDVIVHLHLSVVAHRRLVWVVHTHACCRQCDGAN